MVKITLYGSAGAREIFLPRAYTQTDTGPQNDNTGEKHGDCR